jgi:hypothetical protein
MVMSETSAFISSLEFPEGQSRNYDNEKTGY